MFTSSGAPLIMLLAVLASCVICVCTARPLRVLGMSTNAPTASVAAMQDSWAQQFKAETGMDVEYMAKDSSLATDEFVRYAASQLNAGNADVVAVDCVYAGTLAPDLLTLEDGGFDQDLLDRLLPSVLANYLIADGKHVAVPFDTTFGFIYYRTDLLQKYNFSLPPREGWTYEEFEEIARVVQAGERAEGKTDFDGFVWMGNDYEGLTCMALEVVAAHGGGNLIDINGTVTVNNPGYLAALERMVSWLPSFGAAKAPISSLNVLKYRESDIQRRFCTEANAMFARNWPYLINRCNQAGLAGKFGVVKNPGLIRGGGHGTLGGWALAVGKGTPYPKNAIRFLELAVSSEWQLMNFEAAGRLSIRKDVTESGALCIDTDRDVCRISTEAVLNSSVTDALPSGSEWPDVIVKESSGLCPPVDHMATICDVDLNDYIVPRPSTVARDRYGEVSQVFWTAVNDALTVAARGNALRKSMQLTECGILDALKANDRPFYCSQACDPGQFSRDNQCLSCSPGNVSAGLPVVAVTHVPHSVFHTATPHHILESETVSFTGIASGVLAGLGFTAEIITNTSFALRDPQGARVDLPQDEINAVDASGNVRLVFRCLPCEAGQFAATVGQVSCQACDLGMFQSSEGQPGCTPCPIGKYAMEVGTTSCIACPQGRTTLNILSKSADDCVCPDSYYLAKLGECQPCPEGMRCAAASRELMIPMTDQARKRALEAGDASELHFPSVKRHYWTSSSNPMSVYRCSTRGENSCAGFFPEHCSDNVEGFLCKSCPESLVLEGEVCVECSQVNKLLIPCLLALIVPAIALVYKNSKRQVYANATPALVMTVMLGMIVTIFQVLGMFNKLAVSWEASGAAGALVEFSTVFTGDPKAFGVVCVFGQDPVVLYWLQVLAPHILFALLCSCYFGAFIASRVTDNVDPWNLDRAMNTFGTICNALFITLATIAVLPGQCYNHPNGQSSLTVYPEILCGEGKHWSLIIASTFMLLSFLVPFISVCVLRVHQTARRVPKAFDQRAASGHLLDLAKFADMASLYTRYRFLIDRFRPDRYWWGNVFLLRQLLLAFAPLLPVEQPHIQAIYVCAVVIVYVCLCSRYRPWKSQVLNTVDVNVSATLAIFIVTATAVIPAEDGKAIYSVLLLVEIGVMFSAVAWAIGLIVGNKIIFGGTATCEQAKFKTGPPRNLAKLWKKTCGICDQFTDENVEQLIGRMNCYDWSALRDALTAWHALAPDTFPAMSITKARVVGLNHSTTTSGSYVARTSISRVTSSIYNGSEGSDKVPEVSATVYGIGTPPSGRSTPSRSCSSKSPREYADVLAPCSGQKRGGEVSAGSDAKVWTDAVESNLANSLRLPLRSYTKVIDDDISEPGDIAGELDLQSGRQDSSRTDRLAHKRLGTGKVRPGLMLQCGAGQDDLFIPDPLFGTREKEFGLPKSFTVPDPAITPMAASGAPFQEGEDADRAVFAVLSARRASVWRYRPNENNLHIRIRAEPAVHGKLTHEKIFPGEAFQVSEVLFGSDGVRYLHLADGRGWLFDRKPGASVMCFDESEKLITYV